MKNSKVKNIVILVITILLIIRMGLYLKNPYNIFTHESYDDNLMYRYADSLIHFNWLGEYYMNTLIKNITYPLFIFICYELMLPYSLGYAILNILSAYVFCSALKEKVNKKYLYVIFILLIFSPIGFTSSVSQRTYRNAIIPAFTLLVFSSYVGLFLRSNQPTKKLIPYCILGAFSLPLFWNIKEDSIWVLPFIIVLSVLGIIDLIQKKRLKLGIMYVIPLICVVIVNLCYSFVNYKNYGVFLTNDKASGEFGTLMSNLFSIKDDEKATHVWMSKKMLEKACDVSPTMNENRDQFINNGAWVEEDGEVHGDLASWRIRYILDNIGCFENAEKLQEYCKKVNTELETGFKQGTLEKDNKIHIVSQCKGLTVGEIFQFIPTAVNTMISIYKYEGCGLNINLVNSGDPNDIEYVESVFGVNTKYSKDSKQISHRTELFSNMIVDAYKKLSIVVNIASIIGFVLYTILMIKDLIRKKYDKLPLWFCVMGFVLSAFVCCIEVALFISYLPVENIKKYTLFYSCAAVPLIQCAKYMSIYMIYLCTSKKKMIDEKIQSERN